jgi:hypothetical protein
MNTHIYSLKEEYEIFKKNGNINSVKTGCTLFKRISEIPNHISIKENLRLFGQDLEYTQTNIIYLKSIYNSIKPLLGNIDIYSIDTEFDFLMNRIGFIKLALINLVITFAISFSISILTKIALIYSMAPVFVILSVWLYSMFTNSLRIEQQSRLKKLIECLQEHIDIYHKVKKLERVSHPKCELN